MKRVLMALGTVFALAACETPDPRYLGMDAARMTGQSQCLAYKQEGKLHTLAIFEYNGRHYVYDPAEGSATLPTGHYRLMDCFPGMAIIPVFAGSEDVILPNGCVPMAVADVRRKGGHVVFTDHHACRVP